MQITKLYLENLGPIEKLEVNFTPQTSGDKKPVIFVGRNGTGKTIVLSSVADALIEATALKYPDVTTHVVGQGRNWFRVVGASTIRSGANGSLCLMTFKNEAGTAGYYIEKGGVIEKDKYLEVIPKELIGSTELNGDNALKKFHITDGVKPDMFLGRDVAIYFPPSRNEPPSWVNETAVPPATFKLGSRIQSKNPRKVILDSALTDLKQWLLAVLIDSRAQIFTVTAPNGTVQLNAPEANKAIEESKVLTKAVSILRAVLNSDKTRFVWLGRHSEQKIGYIDPENENSALPMEALSTGQASLLGIFLSILMHADHASEGVKTEETNGVCVIDEIDAHLHLQLISDTLPKLLKLFPCIQFILSAHSPVFLDALERAFGDGNIQIINLPEGKLIRAGECNEMDELVRQIARTEALAKIIENNRDRFKTYVFLEGPTDHRYISAAIKALGLDAYFERITIAPISDDSKGNLNGGAPNLTRLAESLMQKKHILNGKLILVYDCDAPCKVSEGIISILKITQRSDSPVSKGIENLFSPEALKVESLANFFQESQPGGKFLHVRGDRKVELSKCICEPTMSAEIAETFRPLLNKILELSKLEYTA